MPFRKGMKRPEGAGRVKGTPNRATQTFKERLASLGCDPIEYLALHANNKVPCGVCRGVGKTKFQPHGPSDEPGERICQSCWGSRLERIPPKERAWAAGELLQYCEAKRKAIEHTGADGAPLDNRMEVVFVEAEEGRRK